MTNDLLEITIETDDELELLAADAGLQVRRPVAEPEDLGVIGIVLLIGALLAVAKFVLRALDAEGRRRDPSRRAVAEDQAQPRASRGLALIVFAADGKNVEVETKDEPTDSVERMVTAILKLPVDTAVGGGEGSDRSSEERGRRGADARASARHLGPSASPHFRALPSRAGASYTRWLWPGHTPARGAA
jgi:hypothetical protein